MRKHTRMHSPDVRAEAVRLRDAGYTFKEIASAMGITPTTARVWTSPYAALKQREQRLGRKLEDRECAGYGCHEVIPKTAPAHKIYCSQSCSHRMCYMRKVGAA